MSRKLVAPFAVALAVFISPNLAPAQTTGFRALADAEIEGPVVVIDLVTFKPGTEQHYDTYDAMGEVKLRDLGGEVVFRGRRAEAPLLESAKGTFPEDSPDNNDLNRIPWDRLTARKYPNKQAIFALAASPEYRAAIQHRLKSVDETLVYAFSGDLPSLDGIAINSRHPMNVIPPPQSGDTVYMLNLLRFEKDGGEQRYFTKYGASKGVSRAKPVLIMKGITPIFGTETIDRLILAQYDSMDDFREMIQSEEYKSIAHLRTEALELGALWAFTMMTD